MDKYINYYNVLGIRNTSSTKEIKLAYYKISKEIHPDKGGDEAIFKQVVEAYKVLSNENTKNEYDKKSKFGLKYEEFNEIFDYEYNSDSKNYDRPKYEEFVKRDQLNIIVYIDDSFDGTVEYERWVYCKDCEGSGMDNSSKMVMKDKEGNISYIDLSDECEFCDGTGKWGELDCFYCSGNGKVNGVNCSTCKGEKRILGKQKLSGIKMNTDDHKVESMGNVSRDIPNKVGHLWLLKKIKTD